MTEKEARDKWCPMVRTHIVVNKNYYGFETPTGPSVNKTNKAICIASDCMMWRWQLNVAGKQLDQGYCGIGGKP